MKNKSVFVKKVKLVSVKGKAKMQFTFVCNNQHEFKYIFYDKKELDEFDKKLSKHRNNMALECDGLPRQCVCKECEKLS